MPVCLLEPNWNPQRQTGTLNAKGDWQAADDFYMALNKSLTLRSDADPHVTVDTPTSFTSRSRPQPLYVTVSTLTSFRRHLTTNRLGCP